MITDRVLSHLRNVVDLPDLSGTRYRIVKEIGRGGLGTVYLAHDPVLDREVAIKILDEAGEARTVARLEHPGIVPVHDAGELPDGRCYYVMKMIHGERLDEWLIKNAGLPERLRVFVRISEAVAFGNARGVIHGDLKPGNVMIGEFGETLVLDWGTPGAATPQFMAPEQSGGRAAGGRSDVFAMGQILGIMIQSDASTPAPLRSIQNKAIEADPALRYDGVDALAADVIAWMDRLPVQAHKETLGERTVRLFGKHRVLAGLVIAYLVMRILLFFFIRA
jgi:eukaryotic-like serine/threonine-protein kinase